MSSPSVTVLGAGVMGALHANVVASHHGATLVSVVDVDEERAAAVASEYDVETAMNPRAALEQADACIIATPEQTHADIFEQALDAGCAVLLEKPIAANTADANRIAKLSADTSRPVVPGHLLRFDSRYSEVKNAVAEGDVGDVVSLSARRAIPRKWSERMGDRVHPAKQIGTHDVDLLRWISPSPITEVYATATTQAFTALGIPDVIHAILTFESGASASLRLVGLWPDGFPSDIDARMEVVGTEGGTIVQMPAGDVQVATDQTVYPDTAHWPQVHNRVTGTLRSQFDHFLDCLAGADPVVTMTDAIRAYEVTEALVKAIDAESPIAVSSCPKYSSCWSLR